MKNDILKRRKKVSFANKTADPSHIPSESRMRNQWAKDRPGIPEVLFISSYPPRECGIATYSQDLIMALNEKFGKSLNIKVCALNSGNSEFIYPEEVIYSLNTAYPSEYVKLADTINRNRNIESVLIQHEFGLFHAHPEAFLQFLYELIKPVILVFHTVLPHPSNMLLNEVKSMVAIAASVIVMTKNASRLLVEDYDAPEEKITIIAHGTHLVPHVDTTILKRKYDLTGRRVLATFGLLSAGKNIETTLDALPAIVKTNPEVLFLIIGKTHPEIIKTEGEKYRESLEIKVREYNLSDHVKFINRYVTLGDLLEYLQLTDIYLFTSSDPNQAVSGTFAYAMSCACPIISTPIPHAREMLSEDTGIIVDFKNSQQVADNVTRLLNDESLRKDISAKTLQKIISTSWQNAAVAHAMVIEKVSAARIRPHFTLPLIKLNHIKQMTTEKGIIQFSKINEPDIESGYTLDDNARALIAMSMHYELTDDFNDLALIKTYLGFIEYCQQPAGTFLNYVDKNSRFTDQNSNNLEDANGRAIWALGYFISKKEIMPVNLISRAKKIFDKAFPGLEKMESPRSMAFTMKGLYYFHNLHNKAKNIILAETLANRLVNLYRQESSECWKWFESYLTYANSIMPEALLCAWLMTGKSIYKQIAVQSLGFLLSKTFNEKGIEVISNKSWLNKGEEAGQYGEQPIDVAYTMMTLERFYESTQDQSYLRKLILAFTWFLGNNRLHQIVYNPSTGGCYDGLEETYVNLNQGAESMVSYLMARLTIEKYKNEQPA